MRTRSLDEVLAATDTLALRIGTRATASAILLGCVILILIGAQSTLGSLRAMDRDIKEMNKQLVVANDGLVVLNGTMESLDPMSRHMKAIVTTVGRTSAEVKTSAKSINGLATTTEGLGTGLESIAASTTKMDTSLKGAADGTDQLGATVGTLNGKIKPLARTQHEMALETVRMRDGLDAMNSSVAYVIRILNYMTAPPSGGAFQVGADLPPESMPKIPGLRVQTDPIKVFPRGVWPVYTGP